MNKTSNLENKMYDNVNSCKVYRYVDKLDGITKYVGIVYLASLEDRIKQHRKDYWYLKSQYDIYTLSFNASSRTEVEYIEAHFINYYETYNYYNVSKSKWGVVKYY